MTARRTGNADGSGDGDGDDLADGLVGGQHRLTRRLAAGRQQAVWAVQRGVPEVGNIHARCLGNHRLSFVGDDVVSMQSCCLMSCT